MTNTIELEQARVLQTYARPPFVLDRGEGCWVYDTEGNAYLDCVAGIAVNALGHAHPDLVAALDGAGGPAVARLQPVSHGAAGPAGRRAVPHQLRGPGLLLQLGRGGERGRVQVRPQVGARYQRTGEGCVRKTRHRRFTNAFHGRTFGALAATPREKYQAPFRPLPPGFRVAGFNDLQSAAEVIGDDVCAVIVEPVQGEGGVHLATPEFLHGLRDLCDRHDALLIFDEVQCGLGRTGTLWAHQGYGVTPDMLTSAKPLAGGLPMGAVLMTEQVAEVMHPGDHGSTFAASPLVAAVANVALEKISQPEFLASVSQKGAYLKERLEEINSPCITEVRGKGLMVGADLTIPANDVVQAGYRHGLLLVNAGPSTLRLVPPLIISVGEIDALIERLTAVFAEL